MTDQEAAERYATGNHRSSFPDTFEMKAFLAGCAHKESLLLARINRLEKWVIDVQVILNKTKEMTFKASELMAVKGQKPSNFASLLSRAIDLMQARAAAFSADEDAAQ